MQIRFSSLFFHPAEQLSLLSPDQPSSYNTAAISWLPEKYGTWVTFKECPDYELAKQQYARIFTDITSLITQHAFHPEAQQIAFTDFLTRIFDGSFIAREKLIYGEGKRMFDAFHSLVMREDIPLETRLTAIRNQSQELHACADGAINSLIGIVRQLRCAMAGNLGEALRIKEQLLEQLIQEFCVKRSIHINMEKHYVAVYHNFLRPRYGLPSLESDIHAHQASLGISDQDLHVCAEYVETRLTPKRIVSIMAETYLGEVRQALGASLPFRQAIDALTALKTRLTPIYGDIPDALLLTEDSEDQYHPPRHDTLIKLALLQTLQNSGVIENHSLCEQVYVRYHAPDTFIPRFIPDPATGQFIESGEKQRIRGETVTIYHIDTLWWVQIERESLPTLLTPTHLLPVIESMPNLPLPQRISLFSEAIRNTSVQELVQISPFIIKNFYFLYAYLYVTFEGQETKLYWIVIDLFSTYNLSQETVRYEALQQVFREVGLDPHAIDKHDKDHFPNKLLKMLYAIFQQYQPKHPFALTQNFLLNLLMLGENLQTSLRLSNELALIMAAHHDWSSLVDYLCQLKTVNLNAADRDGQTALMLAAEKGNIDMINSLVKAGADMALTSRKAGNALNYAVNKGQVAAVESLLDLRAQARNNPELFPNAWFDINARNGKGMTPLLHLFKEPHFPSPEIRQRILALLLGHGADVHVRLGDGRSVFSLDGAFAAGCFDLLLAAGANPYGEDFGKVLLNAIESYESAIVEELLQQALADRREIPCDNAATLLDTALTEDQIGIATALIPHLQKGLSYADRVFLLDKLSHYFTPSEAEKFIHHLLQSEWIQGMNENADTFFDVWLDDVKDYTGEVATEALLRQLSILLNYTDISRPMKDGDTLLMHLVKHASAYTSGPEAENFIFPHDLFPMIRYLAVHTDLLSHSDQNGLTPFTWAVQSGQIKVIKALLKDSPSLVHNRDAQGNTPLLLASDRCHLDAMALLLKKGAEINARNNAGDTPLMLSYLRNHQAGIQMLTGSRDQALGHPRGAGIRSQESVL